MDQDLSPNQTELHLTGFRVGRHIVVTAMTILDLKLKHFITVVPGIDLDLRYEGFSARWGSAHF